MTKLLDELTDMLQARKQAGDTDSSYVASLHAKGLNKILEKIGEEATETIIAAKELDHSANQGANPTPNSAKLRQDLIAESADLWFHTLIMLSHFNLDANDILQELARRQGLSGLEEKASRTQK